MISISALLFLSCNRTTSSGYLRIVFEHHFGDSIVRVDGATQYTNAAGNILTFSNLEYFISDLTISGSSTVSTFGNDTNIHYISYKAPHSSLLFTNQIPVGTYQTVRFTFGINTEKNRSNLFSNSPRREMFWPENLGGGYHHMKLDGKWKNEGEPTDQGFALHLGSLRKKSPENEDLYFPNYFPVTIQRNFQIKHNEITTIFIRMDVKQWMENPLTWDFNVMSPSIMSREHAMDSLSRNGSTRGNTRGVFQ